MEIGTQAQKLVWEGAIPLQIHLYQSEVTTIPPCPALDSPSTPQTHLLSFIEFRYNHPLLA